MKMNFESGPKEKLNFPEGLTQKDIALVKLQCEYQHATSKEQVEGFAKAYKKAKELSEKEEKLKKITSQEVLDLMLELGALSEKEAGGRFRIADVMIEGAKQQPLSGKQVYQAICMFAEKYAEFMQQPPTEEEKKMYGGMAPNPKNLYKEFEEIHPFLDGNGRVGDLFWKIAVKRETGKWPESLPPEVFKE